MTEVKDLRDRRLLLPRRPLNWWKLVQVVFVLPELCTRTRLLDPEKLLSPCLGNNELVILVEEILVGDPASDESKTLRNKLPCGYPVHYLVQGKMYKVKGFVTKVKFNRASLETKQPDS